MHITNNLILSISFDYWFLPVMIVIAVTWLVPLITSFRAFGKIPSVILEIIAGYLIGVFFGDLFTEDSIYILEFLALTGFIFLMFMSGLEIDVDQIFISLPRKKLTMIRFLKNPFLVGIAFFIITLLLSYSGTLFLNTLISITDLWYFSLIMVTTSVGIIYPVLKNRNETGTRMGQMILLAAAVADILSIVLFTFTAYIIKNGFRSDLLLVFALFAAFYLFYRIGSRLRNVSYLKRIAFHLSHAVSQLSVRGSFLIILIFVTAAQFIGNEVILLGAFLAGLLLSVFLHKERSLLMIKLDSIGFGFFIPVFFIMVGLKFDPASLAEFDDTLVAFLIFLLIVLFAVKIIPSFLWTTIFGFRKSMAGGFLMSSRLSLIIAASAIGLELGVITPGMNACFIIMAVVTCLISPFVYNLIDPVDVLSGDKTIIIGGSSTAVLLARRLKMHEKKAVIVEKKEDRFRDIESKGIRVLRADGLNKEDYQKLKLRPENYVVILTEDDQRNLEITRLLKYEFGHQNIITRSGSREMEQHFKRLEIETFDVIRILATTIENLILRPTTYHTLVESFENYNLDEIKITSPRMDGARVSEIPFHQDSMLMLVRRGEEIHIPHGDTLLRQGDLVTVFGTGTALEDSKRMMS